MTKPAIFGVLFAMVLAASVAQAQEPDWKFKSTA